MSNGAPDFPCIRQGCSPPQSSLKSSIRFLQCSFTTSVHGTFLLTATTSPRSLHRILVLLLDHYPAPEVLLSPVPGPFTVLDLSGALTGVLFTGKPAVPLSMSKAPLVPPALEHLHLASATKLSCAPAAPLSQQASLTSSLSSTALGHLSPLLAI